MAKSSVKLAMSVCVAVLVVGVCVSASALAATAGFMVNHKLFSGSKALASTYGVDKEFVLSGGGLTIKCSSPTLGAVEPVISTLAAALASSIVFQGCKATAPCSLATTSIATLPVLEESTTLEGTSATVTKIKPKTGTVFSTFVITGEICAAEGNVAINGTSEVLGPIGQSENTLQLANEITTAASNTLFIGKSAASMEGSALLKLASSETWSFL